jgi:hypothetical protein
MPGKLLSKKLLPSKLIYTEYAGKVVFLIIVHIFLFMFIWSFTHTIFSDPGPVPLYWVKHTKKFLKKIRNKKKARKNFLSIKKSKNIKI